MHLLYFLAASGRTISSWTTRRPEFNSHDIYVLTNPRVPRCATWLKISFVSSQSIPRQSGTMIIGQLWIRGADTDMHLSRNILRNWNPYTIIEYIKLLPNCLRWTSRLRYIFFLLPIDITTSIPTSAIACVYISTSASTTQIFSPFTHRFVSCPNNKQDDLLTKGAF